MPLNITPDPRSALKNDMIQSHKPGLFIKGRADSASDKTSQPELSAQKQYVRSLIWKHYRMPGKISEARNGEPSGIRTLDLLIKSQLLYQLS